MKKISLLIYLFIVPLIGYSQIPVTPTLQYFQNFESSNGWAERYDAPLNQVDSVWKWGKPEYIIDTAASGNKALYTSFQNYPDGYYGDPYVTSPVFEIDPNGTTSVLEISFMQALRAEGEYTGGFFGCRIDGGDWHILGGFSSEDNWDNDRGLNFIFHDLVYGWAFTDTPWRKMTYRMEVSSSANMEFGVAFKYNESGTPNVNLGFAFDDFSLKIVPKTEPKVTENDSLALVALYNSTGGTSWTNDENWLTGPVTTWFGVGVENGKVKQLYLSDNNLNGTIPAAFYSIKHIGVIDFSNNNLSGTILPEIGNLRNLGTINLSNNKIEGSIPQEFCRLFNLNGFDFSNNLLSGNLPDRLHWIKWMTAINVENNKLTGNIPLLDSWTVFTGYGSFRNNKFTSISTFSGEQFYFYLNDNELTFEDLEPFYSNFTYKDSAFYAPQDSIGETKYFVIDAADSIVLSAAYSGNSPNNRYQWFKDGIPVSPVLSSPYYTVSGLTPGANASYYCAVTNTAVEGLTLWTRKDFVSVNNYVEKIVYRINNGGKRVADKPKDWQIATPYDVSKIKSFYEGGCWWPNPENETGAPNCIFGSYAINWGPALNYRFPVKNGKYRVNLYFGAKKAPSSRPGKTFNVFIENQKVIENLDIFGTVKYAAMVKSFIVDVTDKAINIDFYKVKGTPQINGIQISALTVPREDEMYVNSSPNESVATPVLYPNPISSGEITLTLPESYNNSDVKVEIADKHGVKKFTKHIEKGQQAATFNVEKAGLKSGIYFVTISCKDKSPVVLRLVKE